MADKPTKPTEIDTWADSGTVVEPTALKKAEGWADGEQPPHEYRNWLEKTEREGINTSRDYTEEVADYTDQKVDGVEGGTYANEHAIEITGDDVHRVMKLKSVLGRCLQIEGDDAGIPAFAPFGHIPLPDHPAAVIPGDTYPVGDEYYFEGATEGKKIVSVKRSSEIRTIPNFSGLSRVDQTSGIPYWQALNGFGGIFQAPAARPGAPEDGYLWIVFPLNAYFVTGAKPQELRARVQPSTPRSGTDRVLFRYFTRTIDGGGATVAEVYDDGTSGAQYLTLSSGIDATVDLENVQYYLGVRAGKTAGGDQLFGLEIEYDAQ